MIEYRRETLADAKADIMAMLPAHWQFNGDAGLPCEPHWRFYEAIDKAGCTILIVAREDGRAIGYIAGAITPNVNSLNTLMATLSTFFVEDRPSRGLVLRALFGAAVVYAKQRGVQRIKVETDAQNSAGAILRAMHFAPVSIGYRLDVDAVAVPEAVNA